MQTHTGRWLVVQITAKRARAWYSLYKCLRACVLRSYPLSSGFPAEINTEQRTDFRRGRRKTIFSALNGCTDRRVFPPCRQVFASRFCFRESTGYSTRETRTATSSISRDLIALIKSFRVFALFITPEKRSEMQALFITEWFRLHW